jgi:GTPase
MLIDDVSILLEGGHGGAGITSFGKKEHSGPDGGNGGSGGNIFLNAVSDITLLNQFTQKTYFSAQDGLPGRRNRQTGKDGKDLEIDLPVGCSIVDTKSDETILEFTEKGQRELFCKGGIGGRGNYEFRGPQRTTPLYSQKGKSGESKDVRVILKLIADFGLIGLPNSGKSSLLNELTNANAKIGNYAFTTLSPNLAVHKGKIIADIPGLIEGASKGKGLGTSFLKHIEKVHVLLHCVTSDSEDPTKDYLTIRKEIGEYNKALLEKDEIILFTKSDLVNQKRIIDLNKLFKKYKRKMMAVSIHDWESIELLKKLL